MNIELLKVLCWVDDITVIGSISNRIYLVNIYSGEVIKSVKLPSRFVEVLSFSKLAVRLFRLGIHTACLFDGNLYIVYAGIIHIIDMQNFKLRKSFKGFKGKRPLYLVPVFDIKGIENGVYFGEYFMNNDNSDCSIYMVNLSGLKKVYTFVPKTIEHIHNIIPDSKNQCLWVFTGDFGNSPGIYQVKQNFSLLQTIVSGDQIYRACFGFPYKEGLAYFTDSQLSLNYLRYLHFSNGKWDSTVLSEIHGPCIYGTVLKDYIVFSTSCEPEQNSSIFSNYLTNTASKYIKSKCTTINILDKNLKFIETISFKKDIYPMTLFQFGNVFLPSPNYFNNILMAYLTATEYNDQTNIILDLDERYKRI